MRGFATPSRDKGGAGRRYRWSGLATLLIALLPLLAACAPGSGDANSLSANQTLIWPYRNTDNIANAVLDPALVLYAADGQNTAALYSGLVTFDSGLNVVADSAASWDISGDGTIYTFHLRQNLRWSDGSPITATDFAYGIDRSLDPHLCSKLSSATYAKNGSCDDGGDPGPSYLAHILGAGQRYSGEISSVIGQGNDPKKGVDVVDPLTLQIRLDAPVAFFLEALTYPTSFPVEKSLIDKYPNGTWVQHLDEGGTNGPLKISSYQTGGRQSLVMVPNTYWQRPGVSAMTLKQVTRPFYADADEEYNDYRAGQLDFTDVPADKFFTARGQSDFYEVGALQTNYFGMNMDTPPFQQSDPNSVLIRRALNLALNKQVMVDRVENGASAPTNHIIPRGQPGYDDELATPPPDATQSVTGNQAAAQTLIKQAQAACTGAQATVPPLPSCAYITGATKLPVNLYVRNSSVTSVEIATIAVQQWNAVLGMNIKLVTVSRDEFAANFFPHGPYQMWVIGWVADYPDPQDWLTLQFKCHSNANFNDYCNSTLDSLMTKADQETDQVKRMQMYNQAEQIIINDSPWIPFEQPKYAWRQKDWVRGFGVNPLEFVIPSAWSKVVILAH